jgi:hypothetical protein
MRQANRAKRENNELLLTFINSAYNVEFVYLILLGINNFMEINVGENHT